MFCPKCGASLVDGAEFCQKCGAQIKKKTEVSEPKPAEVYTEPTTNPVMLKPKTDNTKRITISVIAVSVAVVVLLLIIGVVSSKIAGKEEESDYSQTYEDTYEGDRNVGVTGGYDEIPEEPEPEESTQDVMLVDGIPFNELIGMSQSEVEAILGESNYYDGPRFEYDNPNDYNDWIVYYTADGAVDGFDGSANHFSYNGQNLKIDKEELIKILGENYTEGMDIDFNPTCSWPMGDYEIVFVFSYDPDSNGEHLPWEVFSMENSRDDSDATNQDSAAIADGIFVDGIPAKDLANMSRSEVEAVVGIPDDYGSNYFRYSDDYNDWISYGTGSGSISSVSGSANRFTYNGRSLNLVQDELIEVLGSNYEKTFNARGEDFLIWTCNDFVIRFLYDGTTDENGRNLPCVYLTFDGVDSMFDYRIDDISLEDLFDLKGVYIENAKWLYGEPPSSTYGYGDNFYDYNNLVLHYDAYGEIYNITAVAQDCTYDGYSLKMSAAEFINHFGKPTLLEDNYAEFDSFYNGKTLTLQFDSLQSDIKLISIYGG